MAGNTNFLKFCHSLNTISGYTDLRVKEGNGADTSAADQQVSEVSAGNDIRTGKGQ